MDTGNADKPWNVVAISADGQYMTAAPQGDGGIYVSGNS
jgi:hypothetical protein